MSDQGDCGRCGHKRWEHGEPYCQGDTGSSGLNCPCPGFVDEAIEEVEPPVADLGDAQVQHLIVHTTDGSVWNTKVSINVAMEFIEGVQAEDTTVGIALEDGTLYHILQRNIVCIEVCDYELRPRWLYIGKAARNFWRKVWYI